MIKITCYKISYLEIKRLLQILMIVKERTGGQLKIEMDCLVANLQVEECRKGCTNCWANELHAKLVVLFERKEHSPSK